MGKEKQIDLEEAIKQTPPKEKALPGHSYEHQDPFTGEVFKSRTPNHYEQNDGVPVAPRVELPRVSLRQRIENLLNRGVDPLSRYVHDGTSDTDYEVPDDPDAPLTPSEMNYLDLTAEAVAEQVSLDPRENAQPAAAAPPAAQGSPASPPSPSPQQSPTSDGGTVPTR